MAVAEPIVPHPVRDDERVSWWRITLVIVCITISIPAFIIGAQLSLELGLRDATIAMFAGGAILTLLGAATMLTGARSGLASYALIQNAFGPVGARFINLMLTLTIVGWYAVTLEMFGGLVGTQLAALGLGAPLWLVIVLGSAAMMLSTLFGFRGVDRISRLVVPFLVAVMLWGVWSVTQQTSLAALWDRPASPSGAIPDIGAGIAVVGGALMVGVAIAPDFGRFAAGDRHAVAASAGSYGIGYPLVLLLAGLPALVSGQLDFMTNMGGIGRVPVLLVVVFAIWTTNIGNLYSAGLALEQLSGASVRSTTLAAGIAGTLLALFGISDNLVPLMVGLSIFIPPVAGIYVVSFWARRRCLRIRGGVRGGIDLAAFAAWSAGIALGLLTSRDMLMLTGIVTLDSLSAAVLAQVALLAVFSDRSRPAAAPMEEGRP